MIPFAGWAATAGKFGRNAFKAADSVGDASSIVTRYGDEAADAASSSGRAADDVAASGGRSTSDAGHGTRQTKGDGTDSGGTTGSGDTAGESKVLYHGSQDFKGKEFELETATSDTRAGTPEPGIYLTDDFNRAATQYAGPGGTMVRTEVPAEFADAIFQKGGPKGNAPEFFADTIEEVDVLNEGITHVTDQAEAIKLFFQGKF